MFYAVSVLDREPGKRPLEIDVDFHPALPFADGPGRLVDTIHVTRRNDNIAVDAKVQSDGYAFVDQPRYIVSESKRSAECQRKFGRLFVVLLKYRDSNRRVGPNLRIALGRSRLRNS